jgi:Domain of unknown function (DUF1707)
MSDATPNPPPDPHPPAAPALRASDADRERTADLLRRAAGEGRLTVEELDERLEVAYATVTLGELERLVADVVAPAGSDDAIAGINGRPGRLTVRPGEGGTSWVVSVMGGNDRKGRWRVAPRCTVINVMGGSDLDLNDAELAADVTVLRVFSLMGGSTIHVPDGLNVEVSKLAIMGGNDADLGDERPDPGGPVVRVQLLSIMGGTDVKRGRRRSRAERKRDRERRRSGRDELDP